MHLFFSFCKFLLTAINGETEKIMDPLSILRRNISNRLILLPTSPSQTWPFLPNLSCLSSAVASSIQIASLHLHSTHLSGDLTAHYCHMGKVILLSPLTHTPSSSTLFSQDPFVGLFNLPAAPTGCCCWAGLWQSSKSTEDGKQRSGRAMMRGVKIPSLDSSVFWYCTHSFISISFHS